MPCSMITPFPTERKRGKKALQCSHLSLSLSLWNDLEKQRGRNTKKSKKRPTQCKNINLVIRLFSLYALFFLKKERKARCLDTLINR